MTKLSKTTLAGWFVSLFVSIGLLSCTSNLNYTATSPSTSVLSEIAKAAGVDAKELKMVVDRFVVRGGLTSLESVTDPSQFPILACVADTHHDGVINLIDLSVFASQFGQTCPQIAQAAADDPEMDNDTSCPNLFRDENHEVNMDDLAVFALLYKEKPEFSSDLCHNTEVADVDRLSSYMESFAWLNLDPLDPQTYDGIDDYDYYMNIIGGGGSSCGNGVIEDGEQCDGQNLDGESCQSQGFYGGSLACSEMCALDTMGCYADPGDASLVYVEDFESGSWKDSFRGYRNESGVPTRHARVNNHCRSGSGCLRGNLKAGIEDPVTGLPGETNPHMEFHAGGAIANLSQQVFVRYWRRFDHALWRGDDDQFGKGDYLTDVNVGTAAFYTANSYTSTMGRFSSNGAWHNWTQDVWGYRKAFLNKNTGANFGLQGNGYEAQADGVWHKFEIFVNYLPNADGHATIQFWVDGHHLECNPSSDDCPNYLNGVVPIPPEFRWRGLQFLYAHPDQISDSTNGNGYACGYQYDDIEVWDGVPFD